MLEFSFLFSYYEVRYDYKNLNKNVKNIWLTIGGVDQNNEISVKHILKFLKTYMI